GIGIEARVGDQGVVAGGKRKTNRVVKQETLYSMMSLRVIPSPAPHADRLWAISSLIYCGPTASTLWPPLSSRCKQATIWFPSSAVPTIAAPSTSLPSIESDS
ncbi:hypothetical protein OAG52_00005, partial [Verrucomicrobia bacterium]|nr:hypothetical protein [Verrucomicrobiota bacterium]